MSEKQYVALKQILLGDRTIRPGEDVPILPGRSYHQMLSLGQIAEKPEATPAALPDGAYSVVLLIGSRVIFVDHEGQPTEVTYHGLQEPDEAARGTLELAVGQLAALVAFPDDPEPALVTLGSLTWGDAAELLALRLEAAETARAHLETQLATATEAGQASQVQIDQLTTQLSVSAETVKGAVSLQAQVDWLTLLLGAVQAQGEPLAEDAPGFKELGAVGVHTREGVLLLAAEPANLIKVKGIGQATADKLLTWLNPPEPAGG